MVEIFTVLLITVTVFYVTYSGLFFYRRTHQPLKSRDPYLVLAQFTSFVFLSLIYQIFYYFHGEDRGCLQWYVTFLSVIILLTTSTTFRVLRLWLYFEYTSRVVEFAEHNKISHTKLNILLKNNNLIKILILTLFIGLLPIFIMGFTTLPTLNLPGNAPECLNHIGVYVRVITRVFLALTVPVIIFTVTKLKHLEENFKIREELIFHAKIFTVMFLGLTLSFILRWSGTVGIPMVMMLFPSMLAFAKVSLHDIIRLSYQKPYVVYDKAVATTVTNFGDGTATAAKTKDMLQIEYLRFDMFLEVLNDPLGFELLTEFLKKDFCAENSIFWRRVTDFEETFSVRSEEENVKEMLVLYETFVSANAPFCVNISFENREAISRLVLFVTDREKFFSEGFEEEDLGDCKKVHVRMFEEAKREIQMLVFQDPYVRFLQSVNFLRFVSFVNK